MIRAPVAGRVGALAVPDVGGVVALGDGIATVVPDGDLKVVASFSPSAALGRVAAGQPARMRLDGFPWTAFGAVAAVVDRVADEPDDAGGVRVELTLQAEGSAVPLQHGLPGRVEIEVERIRPAALVLRAAGGRVP